jgi:UDP-glucose 4-epimerase
MKLIGKNVLVTGAAGFIGSHLCDALSTTGISKLVVLDNLYLGRKENLELTIEYCRKTEKSLVEYLDPQYTTADIDVLRKVLDVEQIDVVFDLATIPLPASLENPFWCFQEITAMAASLAELCRLGMFKTFIHCSTSEVYGSAEFAPMTERHPWNSRTSYAAAKGAADLCVKSYVSSFDIDAVIIRPFNTFGPRQNDGNYAGVIPIFTNNMLAGRPCTVFGDGEQTRDFSYVTDVARGFIAIAESDYMPGEVINLATNNEISVNALGRMIYASQSLEFKPERLKPRPGDVRRHCSSTARLHTLTGYEGAVSLEEGIAKTVEWYKNKQV